MKLESKEEEAQGKQQEFDQSNAQQKFVDNPQPITKLIPANACIVVPRKPVNKYYENTKDGGNLILKPDAVIQQEAMKVGSEPYPVVALSASAKEYLGIEELDYVMLTMTAPSFEFKYKGLFMWVYQSHEVIAAIKKGDEGKFIK